MILERKQKSPSKILVVDDDEFNILALRVVLENLGHSSDFTFNGELALEMIMDH